MAARGFQYIHFWLTALNGYVLPSTETPRFSVTDIGIEFGYHSFTDVGPRALNDAGDVVGWMAKGETRRVAFLYRNGKLVELKTHAGEETEATAINNKGQVAGIVYRPDRDSGVVLWENGGRKEIDPFPKGGFTASQPQYGINVFGINDQGVVIGSIHRMHGVTDTIMWRNGKPVHPEWMGTDGLPFVPFGINNKGQLAGTRMDSQFGPAIGMLWDGDKSRRLPTLPGGKDCRLYAINERGQAVGKASTEGIYKDRAVLWDGKKLRELKVPQAEESEAADLNDRGQVVGTATLTYEETIGAERTQWGGNRAILWENGKTFVLNDLIPKKPGWLLERAIGINNRGQILCIGTHTDDGRNPKGGQRGLLLTIHH